MGLRLYDLAGAEAERRFSPLLLAYQAGADAQGPGVRYDPVAIQRKGRDRVFRAGPWASAPRQRSGRFRFLDDCDLIEDTYPDRPSLFGGDGSRAVTRFVNAWADVVLIGGILRLIVNDILAHLDEKDRAYFHETREKRLGATLETVTADRETNVLVFRKTLESLRTVLAAQPYLGGEAPAYADYAGCFQWARCISSFSPLLMDDPVGLGATSYYLPLMDLQANRLAMQCNANFPLDSDQRGVTPARLRS
jgi:hypothetical protein